MADNVAITAGSGTTIATDDIGTVHYQRVKPAWGPDGTANDVSTTSRLPVTSGGLTVVKNLTLTLDTSAYAAGDLLADTQQLDAALRVADGTGILQSIAVLDEDDQTAYSFDIYIMSGTGSFGTENSAPTISDANARDILGIVSFAAADAKDLGGCKFYYKGGIGMPLMAVSGTDDIYIAVVINTGTPTHTASGIRLRLGILQD